MSDVNVVVLVGRLTRDAELKYANSGMAICRFSIAVNRRKKNGDQWADEASFFDVVYWGKGGEAINQYLIKGKQVAIDGELHQNRWEQDGQSRSKVEIYANNVQLLGGGAGGGQGSGSFGQSAGQGSQGNQGGQQGYAERSAPRPAAKPAMREEGPPPSDDFADDIPF